MYFKRILGLREDNDMTQKEVFTFLGCGETTYRMYEKGKLEIPTEKAMALAQYYNVSLDYLTGRSDEKSPYITSQYTIPIMLKYLRRKQHLNQNEVASLLSCTRPQYAEYEEGRKAISLTMLIILCDYYNITLDYVCGAI